MKSPLPRRLPAALLGMIAIAVAVALVLVFSIAKDVQQINRQGDAALFEQLTENIHAGKGAVSNVFANTQNFIDKGYVANPTGELIGKDLEPPSVGERNMLRFHAYYILFLIAPFLAFVQSSLLLTLAQSFCYFGLIVSVAALAFRETRSLWAALLLSALVLVNSNWLGGLLGQFYPDRLFVLAGFLVCWLSWKRGFSLVLVLMALLTAAINERAALIAGIAIIGCAMSREEVSLTRIRTWPWKIMVLGGVMLAYAYLEKTYGLDNLYYGGGYLPKSPGELVARLDNPDFQRNLGIFFANNAILMLLALPVPRLALLSLLVMMPNLIGNIGGAEKTGWLTHYHSYYFPVLAFAATAGASRLYAIWQQKFQRQTGIANGLISILIGASALLLYKVILQYDDGLPLKQAIAAAQNNFSDWRYGRPTGYAIRSEAKSMFAAGAQVQTTESGMALLHDHVRISVFPVAAEQADALFIPCDWLHQGPPGYTHPPAEFDHWLRLKGFDVSHANMLRAISYCAVHRLRPEPRRGQSPVAG
ncbi:Predicted membrane protein [Noviherbaspirillum humi]|uniref:Predicted membrane protein n=1 Tax=Noviherbaspirillum humi TaxID=1688639 RepID=A0A239CWR6_9BURK|nr:DUF2079 domain-containing protein [Noviherbaspirillum humi]SNS23803.1 Predicted membrane protein [Noviherbaspirillum humi]